MNASGSTVPFNDAQGALHNRHIMEDKMIDPNVTTCCLSLQPHQTNRVRCIYTQTRAFLPDNRLLFLSTYDVLRV